MSAIKIVADENIPALDPLFGQLGQIYRLPGRSMSADQLVDADVLLVRSVTQVNRDLLQGSQVKFVGTATIGTDHVDETALADLGIQFASAPGCNADAVTEYVLSVLLHLADEQSFSIFDKTVGIVGVGNVGSRLAARLQALGVKTLLCDPPRVDQDPTISDQFMSLTNLLNQADIVTLHTPLTHQHLHPTHHLLNANNLPFLKPNAILINAGRGPVIDNEALLSFTEDRPDVTLVLDVWEKEPEVNRQLASHVRIATPHIAGYSLEGKIRGTWMLYQAYCAFTDRSPLLKFEDLLPKAEVTSMTLSETASLLPPVKLLYDPYHDDRAFRATLVSDTVEQRRLFDLLRKTYPVRREFSALKLNLSDHQLAHFKALGFSVSET